MCYGAWIVRHFSAPLLMHKTLQTPLRLIIALALLLTAAPASRAAYDADLYDSLLKKIYKNAEAGDAGDIYSIIKKALEGNVNEGDDLVDALIKKLLNNGDKLDEDVSKRDLARVKKRLHRWLRTHRHHDDGNVTPPESPTTGP